MLFYELKCIRLYKFNELSAILQRFLTTDLESSTIFRSVDWTIRDPGSSNFLIILFNALIDNSPLRIASTSKLKQTTAVFDWWTKNNLTRKKQKGNVKRIWTQMILKMCQKFTPIFKTSMTCSAGDYKAINLYFDNVLYVFLSRIWDVFTSTAPYFHCFPYVIRLHTFCLQIW